MATAGAQKADNFYWKVPENMENLRPETAAFSKAGLGKVSMAWRFCLAQIVKWSPRFVVSSERCLNWLSNGSV
jgi:hypothetical protein